LRGVRGAAVAGWTRWSPDTLGCSSIGSPLEESRSGRWEPYDMRVSRTVLRGALGATPEVYSPANTFELFPISVPARSIRLARHKPVQVRGNGHSVLAQTSVRLGSHGHPAGRRNRILRAARRAGSEAVG